MNLNATPSGERVHIGIFGKRNVGKSSLFNGIANQQLAVVSDVLGTTTDPVHKAMELLPIGPVVVFDTPGMDDEGSLGEKRVEKTEDILRKTDIALLVVDVKTGVEAIDKEWLNLVKKYEIPYRIIFNKADEGMSDQVKKQLETMSDAIVVCSYEKDDMKRLRDSIGAIGLSKKGPELFLNDIVKPYDWVVLVVPIDESAPRGRLILPQQLVLRELLEIGAIATVVKETELEQTLSKFENKPDLVITDSQVFRYVASVLPSDVQLTSFSILMARKKGFLKMAVDGVDVLKSLRDGDKILISEGCTHHRQCKDIGTVKLPNWIRDFCGRQVAFSFTSGGEFPENLADYKLVIHCGGCMLNEKEMSYRMTHAMEQGIAFTNYGIAIACMNGILDRSIHCIPEL